MLSPSDGALRALPKAELHVHLDGSLRPATLAELARERGVDLPTFDPTDLGAHMRVDDAASLEDYLARFSITLAVMQDAEALERIAFELVEDHAAESVRYAEVRFCPGLNTVGGLSVDEVMDAVLRGIGRGSRTTGTTNQVIVCALRSLPPTTSVEMAELAAAYRSKGVCAFDLAGAERAFPARAHREAFSIAAKAGLGLTVHAGEGDGPDSIRQALELGAHRIGHGTRLQEDPALQAAIIARGIPLEVCLTSNVQTGVTRTYPTHPARAYLDAGVPICLSTDNRLMSGVSLTDEFAHARDGLGFDAVSLLQVARAGFEHAFIGTAVRAELLSGFARDTVEWARDS